MNIALVAAGAAGMYCGSCLRDNALALALVDLGHGVTFVPTYTPLRVDGRAAPAERVFLNGLQVYAENSLGIARRAGWFRRLLGSNALLRWVSRLAVDNDPRKLGSLTVSMLRGTDGNQRTSCLELVDWLAANVRADVIHLSNLLLTGLAPALRARLGVPMTCGLTGEDQFVENIPAPHRSLALDLIRANGRSVDAFLAPSRAYADHMEKWAGLDPDRIAVVEPGVALSTSNAPADPERSLRREDGVLAIGFLSRMAPEKGLHLLVDAFVRLVQTGDVPGLRLRIAGYSSRRSSAYVRAQRRRVDAAGLSSQVEFLGTLDGAAKRDFFRSIDVFAMPSVHVESKALPVLEALAHGVPVVVPAAGSIPEWIHATEGGLLHSPDSTDELTAGLRKLLRDAELRRKLGASGSRVVRERFGSQHMAERAVAVWSRLGESRSGPASSSDSKRPTIE